MQQINLFLSSLKVLNWPFSCYATVYSPFLGCKMIKFGQFYFIKNWFLMFLLNDMKFFFFRGFCYFNSVAIAARLLRLRMSVEKVLVIDWVCYV